MVTSPPGSVAKLFHALAQHDILAHLSYSDLNTFIRCVALLKDDIYLAQPQSVSPEDVPSVLPPAITLFLAAITRISPQAVDDLWDIVCDLVWSLPSREEERRTEEDLFREHGFSKGIALYTLYPPVKRCVNPECQSSRAGPLLKKAEQRQVVIFTLAHGAHPAWSVHLRCRECHTNYHNNYHVKGNMRTYYPGIPQFLQVGEHQFVQHELVMHWMDLMQVAVSATNCARLYDIAQSRRSTITTPFPSQFSTSIRTEAIWDAFSLLALLDDHTRRHLQLTLPHDGDQKERFSHAMRERTERIIMHGQEELPHACDGCTRLFTMPDDSVVKTEVVVTDGVTIGRPCCAVPRCTNALDSTRHRFCSIDPAHRKLEFTCAIEGCDRPVVRDGQVVHKACDDPAHQRMEKLNIESVESGKSKGQRERLSKLNDMLGNELPPSLSGSTAVQDHEEWYEHDERNGAVQVVRPAKTTSTGISDLHEPATTQDTTPAQSLDCTSKTLPKKIKAIFQRQRTNNEQLVVRPCGIINGRGTMYNHEAVSNVLILLEQLYSLPRARKPEHIIYDSNCNALREVESRNITFYQNIGMCVDAFHHKTKHRTSDTFCQERCNMKAYPELMDGKGGYYFNSSIAEQTNVWFGAFHNICREMIAVKYDFFLDEMILRRNRYIIATLDAQGKHPHHPTLA